MRQNIFLRMKAGMTVLLLLGGLALATTPALAGSAAEIDQEVRLSLEKLYAASPADRKSVV